MRYALYAEWKRKIESTPRFGHLSCRSRLRRWGIDGILWGAQSFAALRLSVRLHANTMTKGNKIGECFRQNRCILLVDGFGRYGSDDESMIINDGQFFFPFWCLCPEYPVASPLFLRPYLTHLHEGETRQVVRYQAGISPNGENYAFIYQIHVKKNIFDLFLTNMLTYWQMGSAASIILT